MQLSLTIYQALKNAIQCNCLECCRKPRCNLHYAAQRHRNGKLQDKTCTWRVGNEAENEAWDCCGRTYQCWQHGHKPWLNTEVICSTGRMLNEWWISNKKTECCKNKWPKEKALQQGKIEQVCEQLSDPHEQSDGTRSCTFIIALCASYRLSNSEFVVLLRF